MQLQNISNNKGEALGWLKSEEVMEYKNRYYLLRHGNSLANKKNLIVSNLDIGVKEYGLSDEGREAVIQNSQNISKKNYIFVSSPFKRAKETAILTAERFGISNIEYSNNLSERYFGLFDMKDSLNYNTVWKEDLIDPGHKIWKNESVEEVAERTGAVIKELEIKYNNRDIIIVSHGDSLQILECVIKGIAPKFHRSLVPLEQGEFRVI